MGWPVEEVWLPHRLAIEAVPKRREKDEPDRLGTAMEEYPREEEYEGEHNLISRAMNKRYPGDVDRRDRSKNAAQKSETHSSSVPEMS